MFGGGQNNAFGQNTQQQPQQPQQTPFGQNPQQPSAFGAFGQSNTFGAQPQQNSAFGQTQPTAPSAFGTFGQQKPGFGAAGSVFGQPATQAPATTGFGFGSTTAGTSTFGAPSTTNGTTGGLFGRPATSTGTFGTTNTTTGTSAGGLFGGPKPATTGFGGAAVPTANNGTGAPAYQATQDRESATGNAISHYQTITAMPAYKGFSLEELRLQDYSAGRKTAASAGFGQTTGFGSTPGATAVGTFGGTTSTFGSTAPGSTFGAQPQSNTAFGSSTAQPSTSTFGGFGQTGTTNTTGGLFGQQATQPPTGVFGQSTAAPAGGLFSGNGGFGQQPQPQPQQPSGLFGSSTAFGQNNQNKGFGSFGQNTQTAQTTAPSFGTFGQSANPSASATGFGQTQPQTQPQTAGFGSFGTFGSSNAPKPLFGSTAPASAPTQPGLFGQPPPAQANTTNNSLFAGGSLFGQGNNAQTQQGSSQPTGMFGQGATQPQTQPTGMFGGGLFGQGNPTQTSSQPQATSAFGANSIFQPKPTTTTGGLFGTSNQPTAPATTSLFGGNQPNAQQSGGLFSNNTASTSLFGQPPQNQANQPSLFGAGSSTNGATNSIFGTKPAGFGGLQTQMSLQPQPNTLMGSTPTGGMSLFGQPNTNPGMSGWGSQTGQQNALTASIDGNVYGNSDLLSQSGVQPSATIVHLNDIDKKQPLIQYTKRYTPRTATPKINRLRGFSTPPPTSSNTLHSSFSSSMVLGDSTSQASPHRPSSVNPTTNRIGMSLGGLSESSSPSAIGASLGPEAFRSRQSVKKLVLPSKVDVNSWPNSSDANRQDLGGGAASLNSPVHSPSFAATPSSKAVTWDPHLSIAAREAGKDLPMAPTNRNTAAGSKGSRLAPGSTSSNQSPSKSAIRRNTTDPTAQASVRGESSLAGLKHGDYWCAPSIQELQKISSGGISKVEEFTVGRIGFGKVTFMEPVNLTTFQKLTDILEKAVLFDERECTVYPDEKEKPPMGEGLNVRAKIELEGCWPIDKATGDPIRDEAHPRMKPHISRLRKIPDTDFQSYDSETGVWVFIVPHFTRYGLDDAESDSEQSVSDRSDSIPIPATLPQSNTFGAGPTRFTQPVSIDLDSAEGHDGDTSDHQSLSRRSSSQESSIHRNDTLISPHLPPTTGSVESDEEPDYHQMDTLAPQRPLAATLKLDTNRMNVMQASLFHTAPQERSGMERTTVAERHSLLSTSGVALLSGSIAVGRANPDFGPPKVFSANPQPRQSVPQQLSFGSYNDSVARKHDSSLVDSGLSLARSFRVGWGPGGILALAGYLGGPFETHKSPTDMVRVERLDLLSQDLELESQHAERVLAFQLRHTIIDVDDEGIPNANPLETIRFSDIARLFPTGDDSHELLTWKLATALFDETHPQIPSTSTPDEVNRIVAFHQKSALSDWLELVVANPVERDLQKNPTASTAHRIFLMLTGNQVDRACHTAIDGGEMNLALLLSQMGDDEKYRDDIAQQLMVWSDQKVGSHVDPWYLKTLCLLSGLCGTKGSTNTGVPAPPFAFSVTGGLDWQRCFGLQLWHTTFIEQGISAALRHFEGVIHTEGSEAQAPTPWYTHLSESGQIARRWVVRTGLAPTDGLYDLIRMASSDPQPLESLLSTTGFSPSPYDYRLVWHLCAMFNLVLRRWDFGDRQEYGAASVGDVRLGTSHLAQNITLNYAHQLECLELPQYAAFVLLHLEQSEGRMTAIKEMLSRNLVWSSELVTTLTETLHIPSRWIAEAQALQALYRHESLAAFHLFVKAGDFPQAHRIAVEDLGPEIVIRGDLELLDEMFTLLDPHQIAGWTEQGYVYLEYSRIVRSATTLLSQAESGDDVDGAATQELIADHTIIHRLIPLISTLFAGRVDLRHKVCLNVMIPVLIGLSRQIEVLLGYTHQQKPNLDGTQEETRLQLLQVSTFNRFLTSLDILSVA